MSRIAKEAVAIPQGVEVLIDGQAVTVKSKKGQMVFNVHPTVKVAVLNDQQEVVFSDYRRHFASIIDTLKNVLMDAEAKLGDLTIKSYITGSGGLGLSKALNIPMLSSSFLVIKYLNGWRNKDRD